MNTANKMKEEKVHTWFWVLFYCVVYFILQAANK